MNAQTAKNRRQNRSNKSRNRNRNRNRNIKRTYKAVKYHKAHTDKPTGGAAVKAGSYGCVFSPKLKCAQNKGSHIPGARHGADSVDGNMISKLMYKKDADHELAELSELNSLLAQIPNQEKYFLSRSTYSCIPHVLSDSDLTNFETCNMLTENGITRYNVNSHLEELSILNMKNGGMDIDDYLRNITPESGNSGTYLKILNTNLIKLLKFGIIPLNKLKFNHYDVKSGNVLINDQHEVRLIDWGLSSSCDGKTIPRIITNRSFAFNIPYSIIFFNHFIKNWIHSEFSKHNLLKSYTGKNETIRIIVINLVNFIIHKHTGHENTIVHIFRRLYSEYLDPKEGGFVSSSIVTSNIVEYVYNVMVKYTNDLGYFDDVAFFYEVFAFNSDIFGFVTIYESILNKLSLHSLIRNKIVKILLKYCVGSEFAVKRIDVDILVNELEDITNNNHY